MTFVTGATSVVSMGQEPIELTLVAPGRFAPTPTQPPLTFDSSAGPADSVF